MKQIFCVIILLILVGLLFNYFANDNGLKEKFENKNEQGKRPMKIGILLNYTFAEIEKDQLVYPSDKSPEYIQNIPKHFLVRNTVDNENTNLELIDNHVLGFPYDLVIGYCIKWLRPDIEVNFINPDNMSVEEFKKNDLVFILIYDLLEALNIDNLIGETNIEFKNSNYLKLKSILEKVDNVYPSYEYQQLINSKCNYYTLLEKNGIPIVPFRCFLIDKKNKEKTVKKIISYVKFMELSKSMFITKPSSGQEGIGFVKWKYQRIPIGKGDEHTKYFSTLSQLARKLKSYLVEYDDFDKIIVQKMIKGFNHFANGYTPYKKVTNELRSYYIGSKFKYSIITDEMGVRIPRANGAPKKVIDCEKLCAKNSEVCDYPSMLGSYDLQCEGPDVNRKTFAKVQELNEKIFKVLPPITINGKKLPRLLTRFDVGVLAPFYSKKGNREIFLNEVEFVPSLMLQFVKKDIIKALSEQIINITEIYLQ